MAKKMTSEEVEALPKRNRVYPWEEWMDGAWWRLERGTDYSIVTSSFQSLARQHGKKSGYLCATHAVQGKSAVLIRFVPEKKN